MVSFLLSLVFFSLHGVGHGVGHGVELLAAEIVGSVFCDTCLRHEFSKSSYFIAGASVLVECGPQSPSSGFLGEAETDKHGDFTVRLPVSIRPTEGRIRNCTAKLIRSGDVDCSVAVIWSSSSMIRKSRLNQLLTFSVGSLTFKPSQEPISCKEIEPKKNATRWIRTPPFATRVTRQHSKPTRFPFPFFPFPFPPLPSFPFKPLPTLPVPQLPPIKGIPKPTLPSP